MKVDKESVSEILAQRIAALDAARLFSQFMPPGPEVETLGASISTPTYRENANLHNW